MQFMICSGKGVAGDAKKRTNSRKHRKGFTFDIEVEVIKCLRCNYIFVEY